MKLYFDEFEFEPEQLELRRAGVTLKVDPIVLRLLGVLVSNAGKLVTKQELVEQVWSGRAVAENVITVAMVRLRKTLGHKPGELEFVNNVHGRGYRFVAKVALEAPLTRSNPAPAARSLSAAPFVGRDRVLHALRAAFADVSTGSGRAWVLSGEPGIGKTRLIEVFERDVTESGTLVAWGHCQESGNTPPLWPFAQILRQVLAWSAKHDLDLGAAGWAERVPELATLLPELAQQGATKVDMLSWGSRSQHRIVDAIIQLLSHAAQPRPCVLVLDDLHRADAASLELLQTFIDTLPRAKILLLATLNRLDIDLATARAHLAYLYGHRNTTRVSLPRLSEAEVTIYVSALFDDPEGALGRAIFQKSEGNAFFMRELAQQQRDFAHAPSDLAVPTAALELVRRRLAILDDEARGALSCAAVIGRRFDLSLLQAVNRQDGSSLMSALDSALEQSVIANIAGSRTVFTFGHELLRVALYEALAPAQRRDLHLRVGCALESRQAFGAPVAIADLAYHFHAALPASDLQKTVQYCRAAADGSAKLFAYADALRYLRHARQAVDVMERPSPRLRLNILMLEALCARMCGDLEFEPLARELIRLAAERNAGTYLAWGAFLLDLNTGFPPLAGAREALEAAHSLLAPDDIATRAGVLARLAIIAPLAYDAVASGEQVAQAVSLALRSKVRAAVYSARAAQLYLHAGALDQSAANEALAALEQLYAEYPLELTVPPVLLGLHRAILALQAGELSALDAALDRCEVLCRRLGHRELGWHVERARAIQRINARADTGEAHARAIGELSVLHARAADERLPGSELFRAYDQCVLAPQLAMLTRSELRTALDRDSADAPHIWSLKLRALTKAGLHDEARTRLRSVAPDQLAKLPRDRDYLGTLGALVHTVLALQANEYVEPLYTRLSEYPTSFAANITFVCEGSIPELMGQLALQQGDHDRAAELTAQGEAMCAAAGLRELEARRLADR